MLTVKDLLSIKAIDGLTIVAGEDGIQNEISIVNIIENPDAFDWLSPNELLLSTGYIFKGNEELQNRIIKELSEINCAGLIIKMKRYFDEIPQNMIDQANKYGLPLLELPFEYTLSRVISIINEKASGRYDLLNRKTLDMHNLFFRITLEGGGIERISSMLSSTINNPIVIVDDEWNLLHYTEHTENKVPLEYSLDLLKNRPVFHKEFIESIPQNISAIKKSVKRIYKLDDYEIKCRILPVAVSQDTFGYIIVWQTVRELTEFDYIILEQASTVMALERIKAKEIENVKLKIRQDFFDDLLSGKITSDETLQTLCDLHGLNAAHMYYCLAIDIHPKLVAREDDLITTRFKMERIAKQCVDLVYQHAYRASGEVTSFYRNNRIIILVGQSNEKQPTSISDKKEFAKELHELLNSKFPDSIFLIGIGQQYRKIKSLHKSFSEANEVIRLMQQVNEKNEIAHFEDYSVYHLLDSNIKESALEDFFTKSLGPIFEHDQLYGTSYMITLENYFINNLNLSETAKAMFLHRNTLIYRIEKIKGILNTDLKHSEELLKFQIALKMFRILYKNEL